MNLKENLTASCQNPFLLHPRLVNIIKFYCYNNALVWPNVMMMMIWYAGNTFLTPVLPDMHIAQGEVKL